jgi:hypothetical protein
MAETTNIPGAWYDLAARLGAIKAVASAISQALPCGNIPLGLQREIEDAGYLAMAVRDLIELAESDAERIELELKTRVPQ